MNYGFVIDNRKCIGCHACSTACKSENEVPLGVYRTWVKYTEVGQYPDVTRRFQVTRCNHCDNPPCVRICPVTAMYQREDGIVDFDPESCIGCKACMQACPYDSIHIDPNTNTAAKCNFCAHRVEQELEPACVVVCPTHAIIAGDLDDPQSEISKTLGKEKVAVRKPEQGTAPKLFYVDGDSISLTPTAVNQTPETYMWADSVGEKKFSGPTQEAEEYGKSFLGFKIKIPRTQGMPKSGQVPVKPHKPLDGASHVRMAEQMVQVAYTVQHKVPWHWPVPAYLVTKGLASGSMMLLSLFFAFGMAAFDQVALIATQTAALVFLLITTALLIYDLEKPMRFLRIVLRPQSKSWLARGSFLLIAFSNLLGAWWTAELAVYFGFLDASLLEAARPWLYYLTMPLGLGAAIYTAFLFAQAEGRDLWQSASLPYHIFLQALMCGSALLLILGAMNLVASDITDIAKWIFVSTLVIDLIFQAIEFGMPHSTDVASKAAHEIVGGDYKTMFWLGNIIIGHLAALGLVFVGGGWALGFAAVIAMVGLYCYEHAFVMAPQRVPNS